MKFTLAVSLCVAMLVAVGFIVFPLQPQNKNIAEAEAKANVTQLNNALVDLIDTCYNDKFMLKSNEIGNANICDHAIDVVNVLCHLGSNSQLSACKSVNLIKYNQ